MRRFAIAGAVLAWVVAAAAQEPTFRSTTRVVEVSLKAIGPGGAAVTDLSAVDLMLTDNKREQAILTLERVDGAPSEAGRGERRARRYSILLLDALNTPWSDQAYARQAAARALEQVPEGERVAVFALGRDLKLLHDFTSDHAALRALIRRFSGEPPPQGAEAAANPFSAEFSYVDLLRPAGPASDVWAAHRQRQNILDTFRALTTIARLVRRAPGQKNLLWMSAGFPLRINSAGGPSTATESFHDDALKAAQELNAANVTVYPIDARGLSVNPRAHINIATMQELAEQTGGQAYYNNNDLASMVRSALTDSRDGYVLTYAPSDYVEDGKYHTIRLRAGRRGVRLRHRPGYYAERGSPPAR